MEQSFGSNIKETGCCDIMSEKLDWEKAGKTKYEMLWLLKNPLLTMLQWEEAHFMAQLPLFSCMIIFL